MSKIIMEVLLSTHQDTLSMGTIASTDYSEDESGSWVKKYDISGGKYNALTVFKYLPAPTMNLCY